MNENSEFIAQAKKIILDNFGQYAADLYAEYYSKKDKSEIILSVKALLSEMYGDSKAEGLTKDLK